MDLYDRFAGNDSWHTRRLLEYAGTLTEEQLDRPLPTVVELLPWRESNKTLRQMTFNAHRRLMALDALRQLGVQTEGFGDPMEYEESVAPWKQYRD